MSVSAAPERPDLSAFQDELLCEDPPTNIGDPWYGRMLTLIAYALALEAQRDAAREALQLWAKFAWYATGKSGHSPPTMPLWYALVFEEAVKAGREALVALGEAGYG